MEKTIDTIRRPSTPRNASKTFILGLIVSILVNVVVVLYQVSVLHPWKRSYTYIGHDHPRELPLKLRTVNAVFDDDLEHYALDSVTSNAEWGSIRPPGLGYVFLGQGELPFGVTMWHQIHCLNHIRHALVFGDPGGIHTQHCFNYLREAILCSADITLEAGGGKMLRADGKGTVAPNAHAVHTCRDWRQVYDYLEKEHRRWTPEMIDLARGVANDTVRATAEGLRYKGPIVYGSM